MRDSGQEPSGVYSVVSRSGNNIPVWWRSPLMAAVTSMVLVLLWQFLTVHYNRNGNWTALFLTGQAQRVPPELAAETYRFPGYGYDGQMYRYVAHDIFMRRGYVRYIDAPLGRYRRILIPALAYLLVAGQQRWIDASYVAVIAFCVFLGSYWLSRWAVLAGGQSAWGLAFLLVPATLISMDRMTVDVAIAALTAGFAVYWKTGPAWKLFLILLLACLVRETALLLAAGAFSFDLFQRRFLRAVMWIGATAPMFAWYLFLNHVLPNPMRFGAPKWFTHGFGLGIFQEILHPPIYPLPPILDAVARFSDVLALGGMILATVLAIVLFFCTKPKSPIVASNFLFALLVLALMNPAFWVDVNGYARPLSPLLILIALPVTGNPAARWIPFWAVLIPAVLVDLRLGLQMQSAIAGVARGLLHF